MSWADDPELLATFRAEVAERLGSLQRGLLALEHAAPSRQAFTALFRDAHTVKGSARMIGLVDVVHVAHGMEDLLGALRDGRFTVRPDLVDLLLASGDAITRALPGAARPLPPQALTALHTALAAAINGTDPVAVPVLDSVDHPPPDDDAGSPTAAADTVRVSSAKVYALLDAVGEAELGARRVVQAVADSAGLAVELARWTRALREALADTDGLPDAVATPLSRLVATGDGLQARARVLRELVEDHLGRTATVRQGAMGLAMVPVARVTSGLPRLVRDVAASAGKDVRLEVVGEHVELDKQVLDALADALQHLVTNAVDHGCEPADARRAAGKPAQACVRLTARGGGGAVVIEVSDDGSGVDEGAVRAAAAVCGLPVPDGDPLRLLFAPAFTTRAEVSETSGRGVGLDVVRTAVEEVGGTVDVTSVRGAGTTFRLTLPVTLGVVRCLVARVGAERYAVPVASVVESLSLRDVPRHAVGGAPVIMRRGTSLPLLDLGAALAVPGPRAPRVALVVRAGDRLLAWAVDGLDGELELVVKDLGSFVGRLPLLTGATIDGDGAVVCLLDLRELADRARGGGAVPMFDGVPVPSEVDSTTDLDRRRRILVVEDSVGVRELERVILEGAGYDVETAVDGVAGAARLRGEPVDLVLTDIEMPGLSGVDLTRAVRATAGWEQVPVLVMTSRGEDADRSAGLAAGANAYLLKQDFDQEQLVQTVRRLLG